MSRCNRANPHARNFGLGSRDMERAGLHALREGMRSYSAIATMAARWKIFTEWARKAGVRDMRHIDIGILRTYSMHLITRLELGDIGVATAQNYLSTVNRVLEIARGDRAVRLDPVHEAGLPTRSGIAITNRAIPRSQHQNAITHLPERIVAILNLQREFGLRFEEAAKLDAEKAIVQAQRGTVRIEAGTKGGRAREIPITKGLSQQRCLSCAASLQNGDRSMIPAHQSFREFRAEAYAELRSVGIRSHGERHAYAQARYEILTNTLCPIAAGVEHGRAHHRYIAALLGMSLEEARTLDNAARHRIAAELGHSRIDVTNHYLG